jgi:hypothetical protein
VHYLSPCRSHFEVNRADVLKCGIRAARTATGRHWGFKAFLALLFRLADGAVCTLAYPIRSRSAGLIPVAT